MKLNVGCSVDPWGDVRLDLNSTYHGAKSSVNIYADAQNIPFADRVFQETKAWNILEHLPNWQLAIQEWCRVTKNRLDIEVPIDAGLVNQEIFAKILSGDFNSLIQLPKRRKEHQWKFTPYALLNELNKNGFSGKILYEKAPFIFRDNNRLAKNLIIRFLREKQKKVKFGYRIVGYRQTEKT